MERNIKISKQKIHVLQHSSVSLGDTLEFLGVRHGVKCEPHSAVACAEAVSGGAEQGSAPAQ